MVTRKRFKKGYPDVIVLKIYEYKFYKSFQNTYSGADTDLKRCQSNCL